MSGKERAYDHGIQSGTGESTVCARETLGRLEEGLKVGLVVEGTISLGASIVESLRSSGSCGQGRRESVDRRETHVVECRKANVEKCWAAS